jgi:glycerol-3-phosphate acyltransferase PlsX
MVLKTLEGTMKSMGKEIKKQFTKPWFILNLLTSFPILKNIIKTFDYKNNAGAIVLGLNYIGVKTHGSADCAQFLSTLRLARDAVINNLIEKIKTGMIKK